MSKTLALYYRDDLDADEQVSMEEDIASLIFSRQEDAEDGYIGEQDCGDLGRYILKYVLEQFRPDLFTTADEDDQQAQELREQRAWQDEQDAVS